MTAEAAVEAAKAAHRDDRPLTAQEFAGIRDAITDATTDVVTRGALRELGSALERQSNARMQRQQAEAQVERGRERVRQLEARVQRWQELDPFVAALFVAAARTRDPALVELAKVLGQPRPAEPPRNFEPELLTAIEREFG